MEIWKNINGYEGLYEVSNLGRVRSLDRWTNSKCGSMQLHKGRILKPQLNRYGYQYVNLSKDGKVKKHKVHRLVADTFLPNPQNLKEINHIDEDKTNNRASNLEWCSRIYNVNFGSRNEKIAKALKEKPNIVLSKRVMQINPQTDEVVKIWNSTNECGRNGFKPGAISRCCRGKLKTHHGYKWQYIKDSFYAIQNCSRIDFPNLDEEVII